MDRGHSVGAMRSDDGQMRHAYLALASLFHQADAFNTSFITRKAMPDFINQTAVNLVNNLELPGKKDFKPSDRPLLEGFRQERVIGIGQRLLGKVPRMIPTELRFVQQNSHEFRDRHGGMSIVELYRSF